MNTSSEKYLKTFIAVALVAALIAPLVFIWSVNTLFGLNIAYGFFEWLAGLFLLGFLKGGAKFSTNK